jgi:3'-phosphoadenosine 5'-phosphosulfate (PAPS) 3'-phosphatase
MLFEVTVAVALTIAVIAAVTHVLLLAAGQRRHTEQRTVAVWETGNLMEDFLTRPWPELTTEKLTATELSATCRRTLPDGRLRVQVAAEGEADTCRRISIQLDWQNAAGQRILPVRLVAWRYRPRETGP